MMGIDATCSDAGNSVAGIARRSLVGLLCATPGMARAGIQGGRASHPLTRDAVVLFQGDSITDGGREQGSDPNHDMGQSYAYLVAAELGSRHPGRRLRFVNRGVSGNRVGDLARRWAVDAIDLKPDVISILVGVNDTFFADAADDGARLYEERYDRLIAETLRALPRVAIVVGEPFLLPVGRFAASYGEAMARLKPYRDAVVRLAARHRLALIRYQAAFDAALRSTPADHWSWDGIHPTYAGHGLMSRMWIDRMGRVT